MSVSNTLHAVPVDKPEDCEPSYFFRETAVQDATGVQGVATGDAPEWEPRDHSWNKRRAEPGEWMANAVSGRKAMYMTMASFKPDAVKRWEGRRQVNVSRVGGYWIDIDVFAGHKAGGYADESAVKVAVAEFVMKTGLVPNFIVKTGSGGWQLHFVLTEAVTPEQWQPGADALKRLAADVGLKIDSQCTVNSAQIMRAPGSIHQRTGNLVEVWRWRRERYDLAEFHKLVGYEPGSDSGRALGTMAPRARMGINGDVLGDDDTAPADFELIRTDCEAVRWAADPANHARVSEPYWRGLLGIVKFCAGADELAHEVSKHHPEYDPDMTVRKMYGWTAGPTTCAYFADVNADACGCCKHAQGGQA